MEHVQEESLKCEILVFKKPYFPLRIQGIGHERSDVCQIHHQSTGIRGRYAGARVRTTAKWAVLDSGRVSG